MDEKVDGGSRELATEGSQFTPAQKAEWVERFKESGLSLRKFSAQHGLGYMSLWRWVNKSQETAAANSELAEFTEIKLPALTKRPNWSAELSFANGNSLRVCGEVPPAVLEQLLLRVC